MFNKILLLGAFVLICTVSNAQERALIDSQIAKKELALENAKASSRQVNESLKNELIELYEELKIQLKSEVDSISNVEIKAIKNQEINDLNAKIASYSQNK